MKKELKYFILGVAATFVGSLVAQTPTIFNNIQVNQQSDLRGNLLDTTGNLTIADTADVTGALNVTGNVDGNGTLDIAGVSVFGGTLRAPNGTVLAPSYSFTNNLDSGLISLTTNEVALIVNADCAGCGNVTLTNASGSLIGGTVEVTSDLGPIVVSATEALNLSAGVGFDAVLSGTTASLDTVAGVGVAASATGVELLTPGGENVLLGASAHLRSTDMGAVTDVIFGLDGDDNSGIYFPALDQLAITTDGVQRFLANSAGVTVNGLTVLGSCTGCTTSFPLAAPNGSAAAPSYAFSSDTDSGLFRAGINDITLGVNGGTGARAQFTATDLNLNSGTGAALLAGTTGVALDANGSTDEVSVTDGDVNINGTFDVDAGAGTDEINVTAGLVTFPGNVTISGTCTGCGAGTPGGADSQIQYNNGGAFGGDADFTFNDATNVVTMAGQADFTAAYVPATPVSAIQAASSRPAIVFDETDQAANNRDWVFQAFAEDFYGSAYADDGLTAGHWLTVTRTGITIDDIGLNGPTTVANGNANFRINETDGANAAYVEFQDAGTTRAYAGGVNGAGGLCGGAAQGDFCVRMESGDFRVSSDAGATSIDITPESGTFTATFDNCCTTSPTVTFDYQRIGNLVTVAVVSSSGWPATSDSTSTITTGTPIPSSIRPSTNATSALIPITDNGTVSDGILSFQSDGNVNIVPCNTTVTCSESWTGSGSKNWYRSGAYSYMLGNP